MSKLISHEVPPHLAKQLPKDGFAAATLLVVGDLMLDRYVLGNVERISPEAPVPVIRVTGERITAGGAGNVALNLAGLRTKTIVAGVVGEDKNGHTLIDVLAGRGIDTSGVVVDAARPTTCKTRVMSGNHQIVRVDEEHTTDIPEAVTEKLTQRIRESLQQGVHAVLLSDYAKGALPRPFLRFLIDECLECSVPVFVDPKRSDYSVYAKATCLTPNVKEFHGAAAIMGIPHPDIPSAGCVMRERLGSPMLLVTQGAEGMTLLLGDQAHHLAALTEEVFDVSGAGDTVISTFATAFAAGLHPLAAAELANLAASIVVRKVGTVPVLWEDLRPAGGVPAELASDDNSHAGVAGKSPIQ